MPGGMPFLHGLAMEGAGNMHDAYIFPLSSMPGSLSGMVRLLCPEAAGQGREGVSGRRLKDRA